MSLLLLIYIQLKVLTCWCVRLNNDINILGCQRYLKSKIYSIKLENSDIISVIKALDPCNAHVYDNISIKILKICDSAIMKPVAFLFKNCISQCIFPDNWKKSNIFPSHKKGDKQNNK